jgi:hypothetical protein
LRSLVVLLALGLVPAVIVAWVFEMTPEGVKRESEIDRGQSITGHTGKKLNLATIVLLIAAQLIEVATDQHLWAETFDRELTAENIFEIQSEIAHSDPHSAPMSWYKIR